MVVLSSDLLETEQKILEGLHKTMPFETDISIQVNQYDTGSDILLTTEQQLSNIVQVELASWASNTNIKRISLCHKRVIKNRLIYQNSPPSIIWGSIEISPPPGCFLQPTVYGEKILQKLFLSICKNTRHCLDLFAGTGTLSANLLAQKVRVTAIDAYKECLDTYRIGHQKAKK